MADYFLSDVHLRNDRPERGLRLAKLIDRLGPRDRVTVVGDLCDFWFASRQLKLDPMACRGLRSLAEFRGRGGILTLLAGNHDLWLGPFYRTLLDADWVEDSLRVESFGIGIHLAHGHLLGARSAWKALMESRAFLRGFSLLPGPIARALEVRLDRSNEAHRGADEIRHLAVFRREADAIGDEANLVIFGHIHRTLDDTSHAPRLVVLGGWHRGASFLEVSEAGVNLIIETGE